MNYWESSRDNSEKNEYTNEITKILPVAILCIIILASSSYLAIRFIRMSSYSIPCIIALICGWIAAVYWIIKEGTLKFYEGKSGLRYRYLIGSGEMKWENIKKIEYGGNSKRKWMKNERIRITDIHNKSLYIGVRTREYMELWKKIYMFVKNNHSIWIDPKFKSRIEE